MVWLGVGAGAKQGCSAAAESELVIVDVAVAANSNDQADFAVTDRLDGTATVVYLETVQADGPKVGMLHCCCTSRQGG